MKSSSARTVLLSNAAIARSAALINLVCIRMFVSLFPGARQPGCLVTLVAAATAETRIRGFASPAFAGFAFLGFIVTRPPAASILAST
jgi:hypothetical protein